MLMHSLTQTSDSHRTHMDLGLSKSHLQRQSVRSLLVSSVPYRVSQKWQGAVNQCQTFLRIHELCSVVSADYNVNASVLKFAESVY